MVLLFGTLAWWPLDAVVWPEERYVTAFFWLRVRASAVELLALAVATALLGSFFLPFAANRAAPTASAQMALLAFAALSSVLAGELATRLTRQTFFQKRELDPAAHAQGFGLLGLRERLRAADGTLTLESHPGRGTCVTATLHAPPTEPEDLS